MSRMIGIDCSEQDWHTVAFMWPFFYKLVYLKVTNIQQHRFVGQRSRNRVYMYTQLHHQYVPDLKNGLNCIINVDKSSWFLLTSRTEYSWIINTTLLNTLLMSSFRTSPYKYSDTVTHTHTHQWSTSMSGPATPFLLSLLSRWVVLSFLPHWKPARYQRCHWLSQQVTATPSPPHWSLGMPGHPW